MLHSTKLGGVGHMLGLIGRAKDTLVDVYENGPIHETNENSADLRKLKEARLVIVTGRGYRVHPKMAALMNYYLETEASSFLGTQHAERIPEIRYLVDQYLDNRMRGIGNQADAAFNTLEGVVYEITMDLQESCARLRSRVNHDFGYSKTLIQKQRENQVAIEQAEKLVKGMKAFSFSMLADIAGDHAELNTLLCVEMYRAIWQCQKDLAVILDNLSALMMRYRVRLRDKDLIHAFDRYLELVPNWDLSGLPALPDGSSGVDGYPAIWLSEQLKLSSNIDPTKVEIEESLAEVVRKVASSHKGDVEHVPAVTLAEPREFDIDTIEVELEVNELEVHCDNLFTKVYIGEYPSGVTAKTYFDSPELGQDLPSLSCDLDVWLFSVLNYHTSMSQADQADFTVNALGDYAHVTQGDHGYGNFHLDDVFVEARG